MFAHLLHAQPVDVRRWTWLELIDRKKWVDAYLKARSGKDKGPEMYEDDEY